jgi:diguanylate cyclase (GGDEF)-like protein/PAS domain S-box-containing protein
VIRTIDKHFKNKASANHTQEPEDTSQHSNMAVKVSLVNVGKDLWTYLCRHTPPPLAISNLASEQQLTDILQGSRIDSKAIVLGHHIKEPLQVVNWILEHDKSIKIFLLRKPSDFDHMDQTIQASPLLSKSIDMWSTADIKALPAALKTSLDNPNTEQNNLIKFDESSSITSKIIPITPEQNSEHKLDTIMQAAAIGLLSIDNEDTIVGLNSTAAKMLNLDEHDSLGTPLSLIFKQSEIIKLHHVINSCHDESEEIHPEIKLIHSDDTIKYFKASAFQDENDETVYSLILQDVTETSVTENKLEQEQQRNRITLKLLKDGVIATDMECKVESMNPVAEGLTGWPSYEAKEKHVDSVLKLIDANTRERITNLSKESLDSGKAVESRGNLILLDRFNNEHPIELSITPSSSLNIETGGLVLIFKDSSETNRLTQEISHQASHDSLTGLLNRQEFELRLEGAISSAATHDVQHVLCYLDLNQFKIINAQAGHTAGDIVLKQAADHMKQHMRSIDIFARLGGDEFALLLVNTTTEQAKTLAQNLINTIRNSTFKWRDQHFEIGISVGLIAIDKHSQDPAHMLTRAELACFTAKDHGRNKLHIHKKEDDELTRRHTEMMRAAGVTGALQEDRFRIYCQPIVALSPKHNESLHYELLIRLTDPQGDLIMPASFIPAAERYGLMTSLDRWMISTAFNRYNDTFGEHSGVQIAINLSGNSLNDDSLLDFIKSEITRTAIEPTNVCFEITETAAISNLDQVSQLILELKRIGCRFALDDFGSGLSSFTYLKNLPVDYLKIDGSFVHDMIDDSIDHAMVEAINQVGHIMGIGTIAECAESEEVVNMLRQLGVDYAQGYAMGAPVPIEGLKQPS